LTEDDLHVGRTTLPCSTLHISNSDVNGQLRRQQLHTNL